MAELCLFGGPDAAARRIVATAAGDRQLVEDHFLQPRENYQVIFSVSTPRHARNRKRKKNLGRVPLRS